MITLRTTTGDDEEFLYSLYCSIRADEVSQFGWDPAQTEAFLRMQFNAREAAYEFQFPGAEDRVIHVNGERAGRLLFHRSAGRILLVDIAVAVKDRGNGIATWAVRGVQREAVELGVPVVLRVDKANIPAITLYEKMGFTSGVATDIFVEMTWKR